MSWCFLLKDYGQESILHMPVVLGPHTLRTKTLRQLLFQHLLLRLLLNRNGSNICVRLKLDFLSLCHNSLRMITPHPVVIHFVWPVVFWNY